MTTYPGAAEHCDGIDSNCDLVEADVATADGYASYSSIQQAIDYSSDGSVVVVCDGTYTENLVIDKAIRLESANGSETTIIDGGGAGSTLTVAATAAVAGFTIQGGTGSPNPYETTQLIGGGVLALADVVLEDCEIANNEADFGAGLYADLGVQVDLDGVVIGGNAAVTAGGGLYLTGATVFFNDVDVTSNAADYGGGAYVTDTIASYTGTSFDNNLAEFGGGMFLSNSALTMASTTVSANDGNSLGGGFLLTAGSELEGGVISGNLATWGAGILIEEESLGTYTTTLTDLEITDNLADRTYSSGGGVYAANATVVMTGVTLAGNYAQDEGGGLSVDGSEATLDSCTITANEAVLYGGGAHVFTGSLESIDSDWGSGAVDNVPDDVSVTGSVTYDDYETGESFVCDDSSGVCG
jgi:hypothetical protein